MGPIPGWGIKILQGVAKKTKKESFASEQKEALFCLLEEQEAGGSFLESYWGA